MEEGRAPLEPVEQQNSKSFQNPLRGHLGTNK